MHTPKNYLPSRNKFNHQKLYATQKCLQSEEEHRSKEIQCRKFTIQFPKNYSLLMNIPKQIKIAELTKIMKSYEYLHKKYGYLDQRRENEEGQECARIIKRRPLFLSTLDGNSLIDGLLCSGVDACMGLLGNFTEFKIEYGLDEEDFKKIINEDGQELLKPQAHLQSIKKERINSSKNNHSYIQKTFSKLSHPSKCFQAQNLLAYKIQGQFIIQPKIPWNIKKYIVRERTNGKLYTLWRFKKDENLTFTHFSRLLFLRDLIIQELSAIKCAHSSFCIFPELIETFQTEYYLNIVQQYVPITLNFLKLKNVQAIDHIFKNVAKILNVLQKLGFDLSQVLTKNLGLSYSGKICVENFWELGTSEQQEKSEFSQKLCQNILVADPNQLFSKETHQLSQNIQFSKYSTCLSKIVTEILNSCDEKIVDLYFPLQEWFRKGKIMKYEDFVRYSSNYLQKSQKTSNSLVLMNKMKDNKVQNSILQAILSTISPQNHLFQTVSKIQDKSQFYSRQNPSYYPQTQCFLYRNQSNKRKIPKKEQKDEHQQEKSIFFDFEDFSTMKKRKKNKLFHDFFSGKKYRKISKTKPKSKHRRHVSEFILYS